MALLTNEFCPPFFIKVPAVHLWLRSVLILFKVFPCKKERNDLSTGASFISQILFRLPLVTSCKSLGCSIPHVSIF